MVGAVSAMVSAIVGVFTVMRGQSFAGHALTDVATTGGSGAFFFNFSPLVGFLGAGVLGAGAMDLVGVERLRGRDIATGIVLGFATGLAALFLYLDATKNATTGVSQQILFGSIFTLESTTIPLVVVMSVITLGVLFLIYRPLLLSSISPDLAAARGIRVRARRGALHAHARCRRRAFFHRHRVGSLDGPADRTRRHGPASDEKLASGAAWSRLCSVWRDLAGRRSRLRQFLLVSLEPGSPGQFLHRGADLPGLSGLGSAYAASPHQQPVATSPTRPLERAVA